MRNEQFNFPLTEDELMILDQRARVSVTKKLAQRSRNQNQKRFAAKNAKVAKKTFFEFYALSVVKCRMIVVYLALFTTLIFSSGSGALEIPALNIPINDFAKMMPPASVDDLTERLRRVKTQTAYTVAVLTVQSLEDEDIESFGRKVFKNLPLTEKELQRSALLIVARKEQKVGVQTGSELQPLFPQPETNRKLQGQVEVYFNGMRPDLGIHAGVHYILGVIKGDFRVDGASEEEKLEEASKRGAGAGAIFAVLLAPFLAFFVGTVMGRLRHTLRRSP